MAWAWAFVDFADALALVDFDDWFGVPCGWAFVDFDDEFACGWALLDFAAADGDCAGGSAVMMLTGGIAADVAKSTVEGRPVGTLADGGRPLAGGTPASRPAAGDGAAAAVLVHDDE